MNINMVRQTKQTKIKGSVRDIEGVKKFTKAIIYEIERFQDSEEKLDIEFHICIKAREEEEEEEKWDKNKRRKREK